jgi:hypothetical protein
VWPTAIAGVAAAVFFFIVIPGIDRRTAVSAMEILGRSRTALQTIVSGVEVLTYDLELDGVLRELIPLEHMGRFTVEEIIDHDREGRYRITKLAPNGQMVGGAADDPFRQTRVRYLRVNGNGLLFRFTGAEPAALSVPALKRAALQTFITLMQASSGQTLRELQRDGQLHYQIDIQEPAASAGAPLALTRASAVVAAADARVVEFSAAGHVLDRPFSVDFVLRSRELRAAGSARDSDFDIAAQPGDIVLEGDIAVASTDSMWNVVARALGGTAAGSR